MGMNHKARRRKVNLRGLEARRGSDMEPWIESLGSPQPLCLLTQIRLHMANKLQVLAQAVPPPTRRKLG